MAKKGIPKKIIKTVENYTQRLSDEEKLSIERVIIYGSYAKGKTHKWSDIDVCIISPKFKDSFEAIEFLLHKRNKKEVLIGLEPIGFTKRDFREGSSLIEEIKKTGVEIIKQ